MLLRCGFSGTVAENIIHTMEFISCVLGRETLNEKLVVPQTPQVPQRGLLFVAHTLWKGQWGFVGGQVGAEIPIKLSAMH